MDKKIIIFIASLLVCALVRAQTPVGFNYQGVARNADGSPQTDQQISLQISILDGESGISVYSEIHDTNTNEFGLFTIVIGSNPTNGSLSDVDWSSGDKWIQVELDPTGGRNYQLVGSQQLFSVPYAMYAAEAGAGVDTGDGLQIENGVLTNTAPDQEVKMLGSGTITVSGTYPEFLISGTSANQDLTSVLGVGRDAGTNNISNLADPVEPQDAATKAYVDNVDVKDADSDPVNEIQDLQLNGNSLSMTLNGSPTVIDLAPYLDNTDNQQLTLAEAGTLKTVGISGGNQVAIDVDDGDSNPTNEIQNLASSASGTNRTVTITGGTNTTFSIADNDNSTSNEIQNLSSTTSGTDRTISISGGSGTTINVADNDNSAVNEIQSLSSSASGTDRTISISGGTGTLINVADNDNSTTNELQDLSHSIITNTLSLTGDGSTVDLSGYVLDQNNNAGGSRLVNVGDPVGAQDVVTRNYLDIKDATDYAINASISYTSTGPGDVAMDLSGASLDQGGLISGSTIQISEDGIYSISVQGFSVLTGGSDIEIMIGGTSYPVLKGVNHYLGTYLFDLVATDQVQVIVKFGASIETVNLQVTAYKI